MPTINYVVVLTMLTWLFLWLAFSKVLVSYFLAQSSFDYFVGSSLPRVSLIEDKRWYHGLVQFILTCFAFFYIAQWGQYVRFLFGYQKDVVAMEELRDVFGENTDSMLTIAQGLTVLDIVKRVFMFCYAFRKFPVCNCCCGSDWSVEMGGCSKEN